MTHGDGPDMIVRFIVVQPVPELGGLIKKFVGGGRRVRPRKVFDRDGGARLGSC